MRGEIEVGMHGGDKRRWRHILGQPQRKYFSNLGLGDSSRGTRSRVWG